LLFGSKVTNSIEQSQYFLDRIHYAIQNRPKATLRGTFLQIISICSYWISPWRMEYLKKSKIPILVFLGAEDILVDTRNSLYIAQKLNAKIELYEDCGHGLQIQEAEKFFSHVDDHLRRASEEHSERPKINTDISSRSRYNLICCFFDYFVMKVFWFIALWFLGYWIRWTFLFTFVKFVH